MKTGTSLLGTVNKRCAVLVATAALASALFVGPVSATFAQTGPTGGIGGLCRAPEAGRAATGCVKAPPPAGESIPGAH